MAGTVNISRALWDDPAFRDQPFTDREAWVWMIAEASWKDRERRVDRFTVLTKRGQFTASVRFIAERWKWSKSAVFRFLDRLEKRDMIRRESGTGVLTVTICKYDKYQYQENESGTEAGYKAGQKRDRSGTNEKKGEIREKESKDLLHGLFPEECSSSSSSHFERFWKEYPRKESKKAAEKKFISAVKNGVDPEEIISGAKRYAISVEGKEKKFMKMAEGWINSERWIDFPDTDQKELSPERQNYLRIINQYSGLGK